MRNPPLELVSVAVDAMGGDYAPAEVVKGAVEAARRGKVRILLVGDPDLVAAELEGHKGEGIPITLVPSEGKVGDDEHPLQALRQKPRASIAVATGLVKAGKVQALVSMGSTGATMASATLGLGLLEGLERPCIGGPFLGLAPHTAVVDLGSNIDCKPQQLVSFAALGCALARRFFGVENPRVGLLSVGAEEAKGNRLVRESYQLFKESNLNFAGNVEGMDLLAGKVHVVVCDGFVGNVLMKFAEGLGSAMADYVGRSLEGKLPPAELKALTDQIWEATNLPKRMAGPLLGVKGVVVIGHGASRAEGVTGAIETARRCVELDLVKGMEEELTALRLGAPPKSAQGER